MRWRRPVCEIDRESSFAALEKEQFEMKTELALESEEKKTS